MYPGVSRLTEHSGVQADAITPLLLSQEQNKPRGHKHGGHRP
jgi:hypothetical protein